MRIGPSELLIVAIIIIVMVLISRSKKSAEEAKSRAEAERLAKEKATAAKQQSIKYPQLQLLGILVMLAGATMAVLAYLSEQQILGTLSIAGVGVLIIGIVFIILARRR
jgi:hypothetical protein